jgi:threonylcarbamoyladenosine tRNA methylthiotransferase MtaB
VVTGCHAQTAKEELAAIDGIDRIVDNRNKDRIPALLIGDLTEDDDTITKPEPAESPHAASVVNLPGLPHGRRTRPFLKIQDGCNAFCTYCIVPHARGRSRSMPMDQVLRKVAQLGEMGFREVVLTGIHIGCYGQDLDPSTRLDQLLRCIRDSGTTDRVRISSIEPAELKDEIIDLACCDRHAAGRLCPHFHIPLQSGDNDILKRMHRPYDRAYFRQLIWKIADQLPDAAIGIDTLIGFPGETEAAFENTYRLVQSLPVAYLHVFPFSARKGTPAYSYPQQVAPDIIKARCKRMRQLGARKRTNFNARVVGSQVRVLIESTRDKATGRLKGLTDNYISVSIDGPDSLMNTVARVRVQRLSSDGVPQGVIVPR